MTGLFHCIHCRSLQGVCNCSRFTFLPPGDEKEIRSYQNHVLLLSASGLFTICRQKQLTCSKSLILVMEDTCTTHQGITGLCCMQHTNAHIIFSFQQQKLFFIPKKIQVTWSTSTKTRIFSGKLNGSAHSSRKNWKRIEILRQIPLILFFLND